MTERYRPQGASYRAYSPARREETEAAARALPAHTGYAFPRAGGHAETAGMPPPPLVENPGGWNRHVVANRREGQGTDHTHRGQAAHVDPRQWGAHARYKFGEFVTNANTARMQVQAALIARVGPVGGETRPGFATPSPALQGPTWRFTGVTDQEVYAQAKARVAARIAAAKKRGR